MAIFLNPADFSRRVRATMQLLRGKRRQPNPAVANAMERVLLEDGDAPIRVNTALGLVNWGTPENIPAIEEAAEKDPNPVARSLAKKAIEAIKLRQ